MHHSLFVLINIPDGTLIKEKLISIYFYVVLLEGFVQTVNQSGRPKDLEKRARILQAAKAIFKVRLSRYQHEPDCTGSRRY